MGDQIQMLGKKLNLINPDEQEPYILTPQEEKEAIDNAIAAAKSLFVYKCTGLYSDMEILSKMAAKNWDEQIDKPAVLKIANKNTIRYRDQQEFNEQRIKNEEKEKEQLKKQMDSAFFFKLMRHHCINTYHKEQLIVNQHTLPLIKTICYFFGNDSRFETELKFSFRKGLWIRGISGLGKSFLIECIQHNEIYPVTIYSMLEIYEKVKRLGLFEEENLYAAPKVYIDDVGTEEDPVVVHYGSYINWFKNFMEIYYKNKKPFNRLIISTNNNFDEIEEKYGFRVRSRIKQMFNIVNVTGEDMR